MYTEINDMNLQKIIFKNVQDIINKNDPVGLVCGGAPDDEYHAEIGKIVSILREQSTRDGLAENIRNIFNASFGKDIQVDNDLYLQIADKLLEVKSRLKW